MIFSSLRTRDHSVTGFQSLAFTCRLLSILGLASPVLAEEPASPGPFEVRVFDGPDFTGTMRSLKLEPEASYRYLERLDEEHFSAVRSLQLGDSIGVLLFRRAFFVSRDRSCAPTLGSDENPDLIWRGVTADFLPSSPGKGGVEDMSDAESQGYASAILFRRAEGPPPGALLMKRRRSYGKGCGNILRSLNFDRRFIPMGFQSASLEDAARDCVNLRGARVAGAEGGPGIRLPDMRKSDRIALLHPSDLDRLYGAKDRAFRAVLYDGENCQGESITLDAPFAATTASPAVTSGSVRRDILLSDYLFRDRVRSLRLEATDGRTSAIPAQAVTSRPEPDVTPNVAAAPLSGSETGAGGQKELTEPSALDALSPPLASKLADGESIDAIKDASAAVDSSAAVETGALVAFPTAKLEPMTDLPVKPRTFAAGAPAIAAETRMPVVEPAASASRSQAAIKPEMRFAEEKPAAPRGAAAAITAVESRQVQSAQTETVPPPDPAQTPAVQGEQVFVFPVYDVYRLNYCLTTKGGCGEAAASKWCELKGFKRATAWQKDNNIGGIFPTFLIGDGRICAQYKCDGFAEITCGN